jgi:hypothetical protein
MTLSAVTLLLGLLFLISCVMNFGYKIPLGSTELSFSSPSTTIAEFEVFIGIVLVVAAALSQLYVYGGAYLLATVGIAEGLLSPSVQGLARSLHETMIPFLVAGWILLVLEVRTTYKRQGRQSTGQNRRRELITALQFFVGGLVTLGGASYAAFGTYPVGTALGLIHLVVGMTGLFGGYAILRRKPWSRQFLVALNIVTILYSAFSEALAQIYALLPPGINDSLIGTVIAIIVSAIIIYLLLGRDDDGRGGDGRREVHTHAINRVSS